MTQSSLFPSFYLIPINSSVQDSPFALHQRVKLLDRKDPDVAQLCFSLKWIIKLTSPVVITDLNRIAPTTSAA